MNKIIKSVKSINIYEYCYTMSSKFTSVAYCVIHFDSLLKAYFQEGIVNIVTYSGYIFTMEL
jgi:hypothetical protein